MRTFKALKWGSVWVPSQHSASTCAVDEVDNRHLPAWGGEVHCSSSISSQQPNNDKSEGFAGVFILVQFLVCQ